MEENRKRNNIMIKRKGKIKKTEGMKIEIKIKIQSMRKCSIRKEKKKKKTGG